MEPDAFQKLKNAELLLVQFVYCNSVRVFVLFTMANYKRERYYILQARQVHPDKNPDDPQAAERFQASPPSYDEYLSLQKRHSPPLFHFKMSDSFLKTIREMQGKMLN